MLKNVIRIIGIVLFILSLGFLITRNVKPVFINRSVIIAEVADNADERTQGLKNRSFLPENRGMLFCFNEEIYPQFWMKDTLIALDIAFINNEKRIIDIQQMKALDDKPRYVPKNKAKYALEMNLGWFERHKVSVGDRVFF